MQTYPTSAFNTNTFTFANSNISTTTTTTRTEFIGDSTILGLDILNDSSLNFARPSRLSHTAAVAAARRSLRDREWSRLRINTSNLTDCNTAAQAANSQNNQTNHNHDNGQNSWWPEQSWHESTKHRDHLTQAHNKSQQKTPDLYKYASEQTQPGLHIVKLVDINSEKQKFSKKHRHLYSQSDNEQKVIEDADVLMEFEKSSDIKESSDEIQVYNSVNTVERTQETESSTFIEEEPSKRKKSARRVSFMDVLENDSFFRRPDENESFFHHPEYTAYFSAPPNTCTLTDQLPNSSPADDTGMLDSPGEIEEETVITHSSNILINSNNSVESRESSNLGFAINSSKISSSPLQFTSTLTSSFSSFSETSKSKPTKASPITGDSLSPFASSSANNILIPSQPPSLSPCSSTSSLNSSVDMLTSVQPSNNNNFMPPQAQAHTQPRSITSKPRPQSHMPYTRHRDNPYQAQSTFSPSSFAQKPSFPAGSFACASYGIQQFETSSVSIRQQAKSISTENPFSKQAHSAPAVSRESYRDVPWSPAVSYLAGLADATISSPNPDDEGEQVGEYVLGKIIGRGGFSTVREAYTMDSGSVETVAVKITKNNPESKDNDRLQALLEREITIWRNLEHENIVKMISVEETDYATFVFSELCPNGTLLQYIKKHGVQGERGLSEDEARPIFLEIAEAVRYLHNDMRLVHKDIKLDNILLDKDGTWRLCDFGLTEFQNAEANGFGNVSPLEEAVGGSLAYCAPEQLRSKIPIKEPSVDIWSLGVVLYALVTGQLPFNDDFEPRLQHKILNGRFDAAPLNQVNVSDDLHELLRSMFKTNPAQRPTINEVKESRWCIA